MFFHFHLFFHLSYYHVIKKTRDFVGGGPRPKSPGSRDILLVGRKVGT